MLDLFALCPKCAARLVGAEEKCPKCGKAWAARPKPWAWITAGASVVFVIAFLAAHYRWPDRIPAVLRLWEPPAIIAAGPGPWKGPLPEPAARTWAWQIEPSLSNACYETWYRFQDSKYVGPFVTARVVAAELAALPPGSSPTRRRLTDPELDDVLASIGGSEAFGFACMRWGYEAVQPCAAMASKLTDPAALGCMQPPVQRALSVEPWKRCATLAKLEPIKAACAMAAVEVGRWADAKFAH